MNRIKNFSYKGIEIMSLNNSFDLKTKLESFARNDTMISSILYGIIFDESIQTNVPTDKFDYTILMSGLMAKHVNKMFERKLIPGPSVGQEEYPKQFCVLQTLINEAYFIKLAQYYKKNTSVVSSLKAFKFPYPKYISIGDETFAISIQELISITIVVGYIVMCPLIVKRITDEKAMKTKELLRMMGYFLCQKQ
jgi:hypothetical protein